MLPYEHDDFSDCHHTDGEGYDDDDNGDDGEAAVRGSVSVSNFLWPETPGRTKTYVIEINLNTFTWMFHLLWYDVQCIGSTNCPQVPQGPQF